MNIDNNNDLYYLEHFRGNIQKVTGQSTVSTYVNFTYTPAIYGYRERTSNPAYGRPVSFVFDSSNNLYVSIDDTSFEPYYNFVNTNASGNGSKIPYSSTSCLMKIPYTNTPGTVYCPGTTHSAEQSFANNITVTNPNNLSDPYQVLQSLDMVFDSLGYLILSSQRYNYNVYRINPSSPDFTTPYFADSGGLTIDNYDNIYTNASKIAGNYTFTHVYISDYQGQNSATLSLDNTTDNTIIDPNVVVYYVLSSDTSLATFTVDSQNVVDGSTVYEDANVGLVTVVAIPTDSNASAVIYGGSGLITGDNNVSVTVTAQDGVTTQTYNVTVNVADGGTGGGGTGGSGSSPSNDASITSLTVNGTDIYSSGTTTDNINYNFGTVTLAYTTYADVEVYLSEPHATPTGAGGRSVSVGDNNVSITVTAEDGVTTKTYALIIHVNPQTNTTNVVCFKEDTKILCLINFREVYIPIQDIRKGTLVKTLLNGYLPVDMIGSSKIYNPSNKLRNSNRLYKCSPNKYPELTEDLIITGCHSILVDEITEEERETIIERTGKIYITDNKYRLNACLDDRAEPYQEEGLHNIWHLALENEDYYMNYGIYANGLLVETCSKRMMKEYSGMELLD
jgi:hypothetical protein